MSLSLKRLLVKIKTIGGGPFGLDITFEQGLVVIRLDNTHGKSTCLNSIAYALGMEKGIGATSRFPFTPVMNKTLVFEDETYAVVSSEVFLEISNGTEIFSLQRDVFDVHGDTNIIKVQQGSIDDFIPELSEKHYINKQNDTSSERGFYAWLCKFIGWDLPTVPKTDGGESLLYPATIFPLLFVEQKRGWTGIQSTLPYYFKIKDVRKRAIEFIMDLGVHDLLVKKQKLKIKHSNLLNYWQQWHMQLSNKAKLVRGEVVGLKKQPHKEFSQIAIEIEITHDKRQVLLDDLLIAKRNNLQIVKERRVKESNTGFDVQRVKALIMKNELTQQVTQDNFDEASQKLQLLASNLTSVGIRLKSLSENKRKYEDLKKVNELGLLNGLSVEEGSCPACEQPVADALLPNIIEHDVMSAEESLGYLKNQIKTFSFILDNSRQEFEHQQQFVNTTRDDLFEIKAEIRRLKESITDVSKTNLEEFIREEVKLEESIKLLEEVRVFRERVKDELSKLHREITSTETSINKIPKDGLTKLDKSKLFKLKQILIDHENEYGFSSFSPNDLNISFDSYLPTLENYDLGFDTSASDGIRIIWGYLLGMLELSRDYEMNHPGLLIFDEPRQQDADPVSFSSLLKKAAGTKLHNQQVILATSEKTTSLSVATKGLDFKLIDLTESGEKIMRPLP
tara:strand:- start:1166 stop:3199 length:2034 start_codon:yes stop_codon:yes gene_type:complete